MRYSAPQMVLALLLHFWIGLENTGPGPAAAPCAEPSASAMRCENGGVIVVTGDFPGPRSLHGPAHHTSASVAGKGHGAVLAD